MTFDPGMPMVPEVALFVLAVLVLVVGLIRQRDSGQIIGWLTLIGLMPLHAGSPLTAISCDSSSSRSNYRLIT